MVYKTQLEGHVERHPGYWQYRLIEGFFLLTGFEYEVYRSVKVT
jgi:hypothetical protein